MHIDARTLDPGTLIEGDLCIIGAGAAGISMAMDWTASGRKVILLEGGGFNVEAQMQALYHGESLDRPYYPLRSATLHYFGGTTGHWSGFCSPLDPIDFEKRDWVPHSGWPITRPQLDPFYARANQYLELGPYEYDPAYWEKHDADVRRLPLDSRTFYPKMWQFSPPTRMGTVYRDPILKAPNIHLYTYARVVEIVPTEAVTAIDSLRAMTIDGKVHRVRARQYVLACGAIHNARLLLASNRRATRGLGNDHDLVGRYFMEHFEVIAAQVAFEKPHPFKLYTFPAAGRVRARAELALMGDVQRQHRILNGTAAFYGGPLTGKEQSRFASFSADAEANVKQRQAPRTSTGSSPPPPQVVYRMFTRQEQAPNPESRIVLSAEKDELGMPRADLRWRFTPLDKRSIRVFYELLGREMGRAGLGRVQLMDWLVDGDDAWPDHLSGGWHHMGTTRMHEDPKQGVVDADCKVHGIANLFVAGAAVYPTGGAVNPTLTLVAVALRLSDHLRTKVA
ncbi:MAG: GMC family oxidoreductase [Opitutaceae bacterium]|nr:GMC family oxidoreductase [Opitutaceae bacterium]